MQSKIKEKNKKKEKISCVYRNKALKKWPFRHFCFYRRKKTFITAIFLFFPSFTIVVLVCSIFFLLSFYFFLSHLMVYVGNAVIFDIAETIHEYFWARKWHYNSFKWRNEMNAKYGKSNNEMQFFSFSHSSTLLYVISLFGLFFTLQKRLFLAAKHFIKSKNQQVKKLKHQTVSVQIRKLYVCWIEAMRHVPCRIIWTIYFVEKIQDCHST